MTPMANEPCIIWEQLRLAFTFMEEGAWVLNPLASELFPLLQAICNLAKSTKPSLESINRKFTQNLRTPFHLNYFSLGRRHDVPRSPDPPEEEIVN